MRAVGQLRTIGPDLRSSAVRHAFVALVGVACASMLLAGLLDLGADFAPRILVLTALGLIMVARYLPAHAPLRELGPGNRITLLRAAIVALLAGFAFETLTPATCWLLVVIATGAALLDIADGRLARRAGMASPFGARFDMETDAAMIAVLSVLVWQLDKAGAWVLLAGALRYAFVGAAMFLPWLAAPLPASRRRQTFCVVQIVVLIVLLAPIVAPPFSTLVAAISVALLCYSFATDVRWLHRHRNQGEIR